MSIKRVINKLRVELLGLILLIWIKAGSKVLKNTR